MENSGILFFTRILLFFSLFQSCERNKAATVKRINFKSSTYTDARDNKRYKIIACNGIWWFQENLKYDTLRYTGSECMNMDSCEIAGRMYTYDASKYACPAGWHLPSDNEWKNFELQAGMPANEIERSGIMRGINVDKQYRNNLERLNIKFNGSVAFVNKVLTHKPNNFIAGYWTSAKEGSADSTWARIFFPEFNIGRVKLDVKKDSSLFYIRCVKN